MAESGKHDIFLVHCNEDSTKASFIVRGLEAHGKTVYQAFQTGKSILDNIQFGIKHARVVLILVTKEALSSRWVSLEILLSVERSERERVMCLRLLFDKDISEEEKAKFKDGLLSKIPDVRLDFNTDGWEKDLLKNIDEQMAMETLLPGGNVAYGFVYNYFIGYLRIILPKLAATVENSEYFTRETMTKKFYILLPSSCEAKPFEGEFNGLSIKKQEKCLTIDDTHADKKRSYNPAVYSIQKGDKKYFFVGEIPFIISTISKVKKEGFVDLDLRFQMERFRITLMDIVDHRNNPECNNTVEFICYDDKNGNLGEEIWQSLEKELSPEMKKSSGENIKSEAGKKDNEEGYFSMVIYHDDDKSSAKAVIEKLKRQGEKFTEGIGHAAMAGLDMAKWKIIIISEMAVNDNELMAKYDSCMVKSVAENKVQVIPILKRGTNVKSLPQKIRWTTLLFEEESDCLERMMEMMNKGGLQMYDLLPAGKIHEGLAYTYLLNYLPFALEGKTAEGRDFNQRFQDAVKKFNIGDSCVCLPMLFVIVPKSCKFPGAGSQFTGEEHLGALEPVVQGFRKYFLQFYRLTLSDGKKVCYAREYATPAICLYEMNKKYAYAGLDDDAMKTEASLFVESTQRIIESQKFKEQYGDITRKCRIVFFDDDGKKEEDVIQELEKEIKKCIESDKSQ